MAASSRPELMHHSLTAASAFMRRVQRRWIGAVRSVWSPATPANRVSSTSPHGLLISQAVRPDRHLTRRQTRTSTKEREKEREREINTPAPPAAMAAASAGALPKAKAATPGAKTAAAQAGKGQATTVRPKKRSGAARRRSAQAALEASSRPVEASRGPMCPLTPTGVRTRDPRTETHAHNQLDQQIVYNC